MSPLDVTGRDKLAHKHGDQHGPTLPRHAFARLGRLWPADEATAGADDPGLPVLHFTHRPVGFVRYDGEEYE
jgi:hypothetical protein